MEVKIFAVATVQQLLPRVNSVDWLRFSSGYRSGRGCGDDSARSSSTCICDPVASFSLAMQLLNERLEQRGDGEMVSLE